MLYPALLELIAKNGFSRGQGHHPEFGGDPGVRHRQAAGSAERSSDGHTAKPYTSDQLDSVMRYSSF